MDGFDFWFFLLYKLNNDKRRHTVGNVFRTLQTRKLLCEIAQAPKNYQSLEKVKYYNETFTKNRI